MDKHTGLAQEIIENELDMRMWAYYNTNKLYPQKEL